ncbi:MAG: glycoside hydrolase family 16 protein [Opitutaceae bacterium]
MSHNVNYSILGFVALLWAFSQAAVAEPEWLPDGNWALDWADEFSGSGSVDNWHPMLGWTPTDYLNEDEKGLRWNGATANTAQMYSMRSGHHWLNGEGQLVIRAVCDKTQSNANGHRVETAYLMTGYPDRWDASEPTGVKWEGKFVSPQDCSLYISARVRSDQVVGHSTWFAFWLFSQTRAYNGNPVDGSEVDIIEIAKGAPNYMNQSFNVANHWAQSGGSESKQFNSASSPTSISLVDVTDSEYHIYSLEWTTEFMKCYVDGQLFYTFTENIPSDPVDMMLLLTMEFQPNAWDPNQGDGRSSGPFVSDTAELREMSRALVDYVRVYTLQEVSPAEAAFHAYLELYGVEVNELSSSEDSDDDGSANIFEYIYETNPALGGDAINSFPSMNQQTGASINAVLGTDDLDPAKQHYTQTIRLPKVLPTGVSLDVEATLNLPHFDDGSTSVLPYGDPIDEGGNTHLQQYYQVEDMESAQRGFIRAVVSFD